mmetsp:Transcript_17200/g.26608  ORF Transcript_17200/g.26608 Transcript_17200/m.26608 type:complete len:392 (+) Transcript_17200:160-1335(+)
MRLRGLLRSRNVGILVLLVLVLLATAAFKFRLRLPGSRRVWRYTRRGPSPPARPFILLEAGRNASQAVQAMGITMVDCHCTHLAEELSVHGASSAEPGSVANSAGNLGAKELSGLKSENTSRQGIRKLEKFGSGTASRWLTQTRGQALSAELVRNAGLSIRPVYKAFAAAYQAGRYEEAVQTLTPELPGGSSGQLALVPNASIMAYGAVQRSDGILIGPRGCLKVFQPPPHVPDYDCGEASSQNHRQVVVISQVVGGEYYHFLSEVLSRLPAALAWLNAGHPGSGPPAYHMGAHQHDVMVHVTEKPKTYVLEGLKMLGFGEDQVIFGNQCAELAIIPEPTNCGLVPNPESHLTLYPRLPLQMGGKPDSVSSSPESEQEAPQACSFDLCERH